MRATALLAALGALLLPGCGRGDVPLNNQQIAEAIENLAVEEVPEEKGPPPPALAEIGGPERERELPSGSGCEFSQGGRLLFVSAAGDALAKVNGFPVHFAASGPTGATGGYYITERFSLSIGRRADAAEAAETTAGWPARLVLTDRRQEENNVLRVDGAWRCGA